MFADIGVPNAEEYFVKAQLVFKIDTIMRARRLNQVDAAAMFGDSPTGRLQNAVR